MEALAPLRSTLSRSTDALGRASGFSMAGSDYAVTYDSDSYG